MKHEIIMACAYFTVLMLSGASAVRWLRMRSIFPMFFAPIFVCYTLYELVICYQVKYGTFYTLDRFTQAWYNAPLFVHIFTLLLQDVACLLIVQRERYVRRHNINVNSVADALNNVDCGLLYSEWDGTVVLTNHKMWQLSKIFTEARVYNATEFWRQIISFTENEKAKRIDFTSWPAFLLQDGTVWSFERAILSDADKRYLEIVARDVTDLYNKRVAIEDEIKELSSVQGRLSEVLKNISTTGNDEELLAYKVHIHDRLGNAILRARQVLRGSMTDFGEPEKEGVLGLWEKTIKAFENNRLEVEQKQEGNLSALYNQAETLGIELFMFGDFPAHNESAIRAVREAMYNSIRHAYANSLTVESFKEPDGYFVRIYDDGKAKSDSITEGGGLKSIRREVEEKGGSMKVSVADGVMLEILFREGSK
ncbi:MAG: hypothetical protein J5626_03720 [Lachnospiraceae bacterium]|nr:hypothetical protein [Lachnospiraceae bacterium]